MKHEYNNERPSRCLARLVVRLRVWWHRVRAEMCLVRGDVWGAVEHAGKEMGAIRDGNKVAAAAKDLHGVVKAIEEIPELARKISSHNSQDQERR